MATHYAKPVHQLMKDMIPSLGIEQGQVFTRSQVKSWFSEHYPKIKDGTIAAHLIRLSVNAPSRIHHQTKPGIDDIFYQIDSSSFRLYSPESDDKPIYADVDLAEIDDAESHEDITEREFAYERDLQNFLVKNLNVIEPGLELFEDEEIKGVEFPAGGRFIDILATDKDNNLVVIELKVSKGYDRVVGQLLRYTSWIKKNMAEPGQTVRGIIIARNISEDLVLACSSLTDVSLYEYELAVHVKKI